MMTMAVTLNKDARADWARVLHIVSVSVLTLPFLLISAVGVVTALYIAGTDFVQGFVLSFIYLLVGLLGGAACVSLIRTVVKGRRVRHPIYHIIVMALGLLPATFLLITVLTSSSSQTWLLNAICAGWLICLWIVTIMQIRRLGSAVDASDDHLKEEF